MRDPKFGDAIYIYIYPLVSFCIRRNLLDFPSESLANFVARETVFPLIPYQIDVFTILHLLLRRHVLPAA